MSDSNAAHATEQQSAAEAFLRSLRRHGVQYIFGNFGTDHPSLLEAAAHLREEDPTLIPEFVICPHETAALSAAHGYAAVTGEPQVVVVHVDVGTLNLGAMLHNAYRGNAPVFIMAGVAPVTDTNHDGSRDSIVHYFQDVPDQPGILRDYCNWTYEYRPPTDPDMVVTRGLQRALTPPQGPIYVSATREALATPVCSPQQSNRTVRPHRSGIPDAGTISDLVETITGASMPLVITNRIGSSPGTNGFDSLVPFAEAAGAGVVEHGWPSVLSFPRNHRLHVGYDANDVIDLADLIILASVDVPWLPAAGTPAEDTEVIQLDVDPSKRKYPHWDFRVDRSLAVDPAATLARIAERLGPTDGTEGRDRWMSVRQSLDEDRATTLADHRQDDRLTADVLSAAVNDIIDDTTVILEEAVTSRPAVLNHLELTEPGSYLSSHGSGLGWAPGAAVGVKLAAPEKRVIALVGDGAYVFSNPTANAWLAVAQDAPVMVVIYDSDGWNAVKGSTASMFPDGASVSQGVPESRFDPTLDLSAPAEVVNAHTELVTDPTRLAGALQDGLTALEDGQPAVLDVKIDL
ncbi:MAG: thiamine pyrophosphate-requiring protein [Halobacteriales archaeon]